MVLFSQSERSSASRRWPAAPARIQPDEDDPAWFASVAVLDEGGYEIVRRDASRREHDVVTETSIGTIARDLILWLAALPRTADQAHVRRLLKHALAGGGRWRGDSGFQKSRLVWVPQGPGSPPARNALSEGCPGDRVGT